MNAKEPESLRLPGSYLRSNLRVDLLARVGARERERRRVDAARASRPRDDVHELPRVHRRRDALRFADGRERGRRADVDEVHVGGTFSVRTEDDEEASHGAVSFRAL